MVYGYGKLLQIFHIIAMLLGIFMEKISRVPAAGRNWTRSCGAYASVRKGAGTCNKYWDKKQLKITQQNEPEIRSVKKKRHRIRDWRILCQQKNRDTGQHEKFMKNAP